MTVAHEPMIIQTPEISTVSERTLSQSAVSRASRFLGQPTGLLFIAGTEFWERVSYHGMQALLTLYMVEKLLLPGHIEKIVGFTYIRVTIEAITGPLSSQALASQIFGLYVGLMYLTPVLGGLLGDRVLGRRRTVTLAALLITTGHFCMAFDESFLLALFLLILGAGALRGNLVSQASDLYPQGDSRRQTGFQVYCSLANIGAFVAPLVTGALSQAYGWHYGFGFAGFGMLAGLALYLSGTRHLPRDVRKSTTAARDPLSAGQRRVVVTLLLMLPLSTLFWIAQIQIWNMYNLWARNSVDLSIGGWSMPVAWLQAFDGFAAVAVVPPILWLWRQQAVHSREPDELAKLAIGCLLFGLSLTWLAVSSLVAPRPLGKVPLAWPLLFHVLSNVGWVYFAPTLVSVFSRAAPPQINAMMIGIYYLSIFLGSVIAGRLGGLYESLSSVQFWLLHATIVAGGGVLLRLFASRLRRELVRQ